MKRFFVAVFEYLSANRLFEMEKATIECYIGEVNLKAFRAAFSKSVKAIFGAKGVEYFSPMSFK